MALTFGFGALPGWIGRGSVREKSLVVVATALVDVVARDSSGYGTVRCPWNEGEKAWAFFGGVDG